MLAALLAIAPGIILKMIGAGEAKISEAAKQEINRRNAERDERLKAGDVIIAGMQHKAFWIPWLVATVPLSAWFGWGMMDSLFNGALPDVSELPPQLRAYADVAWQNLFYSGAGMGAIQLGSNVIASAIARRSRPS